MYPVQFSQVFHILFHLRNRGILSLRICSFVMKQKYLSRIWQFTPTGTWPCASGSDVIKVLPRLQQNKINKHVLLISICEKSCKYTQTTYTLFVKIDPTGRRLEMRLLSMTPGIDGDGITNTLEKLHFAFFFSVKQNKKTLMQGINTVATNNHVLIKMANKLDF